MIVAIVQGTSVIDAKSLTDGMVISEDRTTAILGEVTFYAPDGCFLVQLADDATTGFPGDSYDPVTSSFSPPPNEDYQP